MGRLAQEAPGALALAVSEEIRRELGARRISGRKVAAMIGKSPKYVMARLNDEVPLNLNDLGLICAEISVDLKSVIIAAQGRLQSAPVSERAPSAVVDELASRRSAGVTDTDELRAVAQTDDGLPDAQDGDDFHDTDDPA